MAEVTDLPNNSGQKERLCLIIDKCRHQKLCKGVQKNLGDCSIT